MNRQNILLLFGGESSEHDVSIMSARNVFAALDDQKYNVELCFIDKLGKWWLVNAVDGTHAACPQLIPVLGHGQFVTLPNDKVIRPDVLLPVLHGRGGEDGTIQAIAKLLHIPIVGCGVSASVLCWDKALTKLVLKQHGIRVSSHLVAKNGQPPFNYDDIVIKLGTPFFVKPSQGGSSIGVSKVSHESEYQPAMKVAFDESSVVLIEQAIEGRELEVAVLGNPPNHIVSGVGEIMTDANFYDYNDKYSQSSSAKVIASAEVDPLLADELRASALLAYDMLGCSGLARVDYLIDKDGLAYLNEINTFPGFTDISQYPKLWQQRGVSYAELIDRLINLAI